LKIPTKLKKAEKGIISAFSAFLNEKAEKAEKRIVFP
jgi:hypothetical protein